MDRLRKIGDQLAAIDQALQIARQETEPDRREQLFDVVGRAVDVARAEHQAAVEEEQRRPVFRVIQGGGVAALIAAIGGGMRSYWQQHRSATVVTVAAATAAPMLLYLALEGGPAQNDVDSGEAPIPTPTVTVTHTKSPAPPQPTTPGPSTDSVPTDPDQAPDLGLTVSPAPPAEQTRPTDQLESSERQGRGTAEAPPPGLMEKDARHTGQGDPCPAADKDVCLLGR
jgi:hypothetical protein